MREISLHIMDLIQNSIKANATLITIEVDENIKDDIFRVIIKDNGCGMSKDIIDKVLDPFMTTRTTRRVGLGLSLFQAACVRCNGDFKINSIENRGTVITALMKYSSIDRAPIGRIQDTIISTLLEINIDIVYTHKVNEKSFTFDSREIKNKIGEDLSDPEILNWLREYVFENIIQIGGGVWE
jgi:hypothetical protein